MCAPFAVAISRAGAPGHLALLSRHLAYQAGKTLSYFSLGLLTLTLGLWLGSLQFLTPVREGLGWLVGGMLIWLGIGLMRPGFGTFFTRLITRLTSSSSSACASAGSLFKPRSLLACLLLGWVNGFVPCALSFGALLYMVSRGTLEAVAFGCLAFGSGTMPVLLLVGSAGGRAANWVRRYPYLAGAACIAAGMLVMLRGRLVHIADWCGF